MYDAADLKHANMFYIVILNGYPMLVSTNNISAYPVCQGFIESDEAHSDSDPTIRCVHNYNWRIQIIQALVCKSASRNCCCSL